jgi:hypothetical protein
MFIRDRKVDWFRGESVALLCATIVEPIAMPDQAEALSSDVPAKSALSASW